MKMNKENSFKSGNIICTFCVLNINMTNSSFDCELCRQQHVYPKNGIHFYLNKFYKILRIFESLKLMFGFLLGLRPN